MSLQEKEPGGAGRAGGQRAGAHMVKRVLHLWQVTQDCSWPRNRSVMGDVSADRYAPSSRAALAASPSGCPCSCWSCSDASCSARCCASGVLTLVASSVHPGSSAAALSCCSSAPGLDAGAGAGSGGVFTRFCAMGNRSGQLGFDFHHAGPSTRVCTRLFLGSTGTLHGSVRWPVLETNLAAPRPHYDMYPRSCTIMIQRQGFTHTFNTQYSTQGTYYPHCSWCKTPDQAGTRRGEER